MDDLFHRINEHVSELASHTSTKGSGVTRVVYTQEDIDAKNYMVEQMKRLGLSVTEDTIGNIFATWKGRDSSLPQIWTGSHMDAPTHGGKYDGVVGVFGGLEAIRLLKAEGYTPECDIVLVVFAAEEPTRFGVGCLGSRALTGAIKREDFTNWKDDKGLPLKEVLHQLERNYEKVFEETLVADSVKAFIELHIEQGGILEQNNHSIGIIDVIAAPSEILLSIYGEQRHAGSTPMNLRRDPMPAVAEVVLLVEKLARETSPTSVGTIGKIVVYPNTSNVIPEKVELTIDIRDTNQTSKEKIIRTLQDEVELLTKKRKLAYELHVKSNDVPSVMDETTVEIIESCTKELGFSYQRLPSGAYHDAMIMSKKAPCNIIFVPSKDGISHSPDEFTATEDIAKGILVLSKTLRALTLKN